jgi:hypothetical protein
MSISKIELRMKYKAETAQGVECSVVFAHIGKWGDVICTDRLREDSMEMVDKKGYFEQDDPDYTAWLEEKLMELL